MIRLPFDVFFQRRRDSNVEVDVEDVGGYYKAEMTIPGGRTITTDFAKGGTEESLYIQNYAPFCNAPNEPDVPVIATHDFCDSQSWVNPDSTFAWMPTPGSQFSPPCKIILQEITTSCWRDMQISGQDIVFVVWESITASCPVFSNQRTPYGDPQDPSWANVYPPAYYGNQEVKVFVKFDQNQNPLYKATEFRYSSALSISQKAREVRLSEVQQGVFNMSCWFPYSEQGVKIELRANKNERLECFLSSGQTPLNNGTTGLPAFASAVFHSYYDW